MGLSYQLSIVEPQNFKILYLRKEIYMGKVDLNLKLNSLLTLFGTRRVHRAQSKEDQENDT